MNEKQNMGDILDQIVAGTYTPADHEAKKADILSSSDSENNGESVFVKLGRNIVEQQEDFEHETEEKKAAKEAEWQIKKNENEQKQAEYAIELAKQREKIVKEHEARLNEAKLKTEKYKQQAELARAKRVQAEEQAEKAKINAELQRKTLKEERLKKKQLQNETIKEARLERKALKSEQKEQQKALRAAKRDYRKEVRIAGRIQRIYLWKKIAVIALISLAGLAILGGIGYVLYRVYNSPALILSYEICTVNDYSYCKVSQGFNKNAKEIEIPANYKGMPVWVVGDFSGYMMETVTLPSSVYIIEENAFEDCTQLKSVNLDNVVTIGSYGFYGCESLEKVNLEHIEEIGEYAFANCGSLKDVVLSGKTEILPQGCFSGCASLVSINTEDVYQMGESVFSGCTSLKKLSFSMSLTVLPKNCFADCTSLEEIELSYNLKRIESGCFKNCKALCAVNYMGNPWDWVEVEKEEGWKEGANNSAFLSDELTQVTCTDSINVIVTTVDIGDDFTISMEGIECEYGSLVLKEFNSDYVRTVNIPEGFVSIAEGCIKHWVGTWNIYCPKTMEYFNEGIFANKFMDITFHVQMSCAEFSEKNPHFLEYYPNATVSCEDGTIQAEIVYEKDETGKQIQKVGDKRYIVQYLPIEGQSVYFFPAPEEIEEGACVTLEVEYEAFRYYKMYVTDLSEETWHERNYRTLDESNVGCMPYYNKMIFLSGPLLKQEGHGFYYRNAEGNVEYLYCLENTEKEITIPGNYEGEPITAITIKSFYDISGEQDLTIHFSGTSELFYELLQDKEYTDYFINSFRSYTLDCSADKR